MDDEVRDAARRRLEGEARRVSELIDGVRTDMGEGASRDSTAELSGYDQHPADTGSETFEREKDFSILAGLEAELAEVEAALDRIEKGTYGVDERTGEPISAERLEAVPTARTNIDPPAPGAVRQ
ncbi:MAG: hypothetical protein KJ056_09680 [Acidimicrobiia bacterium]|nr:hypothetical protein [Acidimicrobiia bacterium]MCL4293282.1 hypothetical protein [Acidimicrobiia bacterium]